MLSARSFLSYCFGSMTEPLIESIAEDYCKADEQEHDHGYVKPALDDLVPLVFFPARRENAPESTGHHLVACTCRSTGHER